MWSTKCCLLLIRKLGTGWDPTHYYYFEYSSSTRDDDQTNFRGLALKNLHLWQHLLTKLEKRGWPEKACSVMRCLSWKVAAQSRPASKTHPGIPGCFQTVASPAASKHLHLNIALKLFRCSAKVYSILWLKARFHGKVQKWFKGNYIWVISIDLLFTKTLKGSKQKKQHIEFFWLFDMLLYSYV